MADQRLEPEAYHVVAHTGMSIIPCNRHGSSVVGRLEHAVPFDC